MRSRRLAFATFLLASVSLSCTAPQTGEFPQPVRFGETPQCPEGNRQEWTGCVESMQIDAAAGLVRREGGEPFSGESRRLCFDREDLEELCVDEPPYVEGDESSIEVHTYLGTFPELPFHLLSEDYYEGGIYVLVHRRSGQRIPVDAYPVASPDGTRFAASSMDECLTGYTRDRLAVWRLEGDSARLEWSVEPDDWSPGGVSWTDDRTLRAVRWVPGGECQGGVIDTLRLDLGTTPPRVTVSLPESEDPPHATVPLPRFEDYPVTEVFEGTPAPVDFSSHPDAGTFRTALRAAAEGAPAYAGHFGVAIFGCGTACQGIFLVDHVDGQVLRPFESMAVGAAYRVDSRLLVRNDPAEYERMLEYDSVENVEEFIAVYGAPEFWVEEEGEFRRIPPYAVRIDPATLKLVGVEGGIPDPR